MGGTKKCLEFGRASARTECGVAYALDSLSRRKIDVGAVRTGIETARVYSARAAKLLPNTGKQAQDVEKAAILVER